MISYYLSDEGTTPRVLIFGLPAISEGRSPLEGYT
jgi:hypothetical protein